MKQYPWRFWRIIEPKWLDKPLANITRRTALKSVWILWLLYWVHKWTAHLVWYVGDWGITIEEREAFERIAECFRETIYNSTALSLLQDYPHNFWVPLIFRLLGNAEEVWGSYNIFTHDVSINPSEVRVEKKWWAFTPEVLIHEDVHILDSNHDLFHRKEFIRIYNWLKTDPKWGEIISEIEHHINTAYEWWLVWIIRNFDEERLAYFITRVLRELIVDEDIPTWILDMCKWIIRDNLIESPETLRKKVQETWDFTNRELSSLPKNSRFHTQSYD
jgi:hypothetical protein